MADAAQGVRDLTCRKVEDLDAAMRSCGTGATGISLSVTGAG